MLSKNNIEPLFDELVEVIDAWNDVMANERGRDTKAIQITIFDDGSGSLGERHDYEGTYGKVTECTDLYHFSGVEGLVNVLREIGIEVR